MEKKKKPIETVEKRKRKQLKQLEKKKKPIETIAKRKKETNRNNWKTGETTFFCPIISYKMKNISTFFRMRNKVRYQTFRFFKNENKNRKQETKTLPNSHLIPNIYSKSFKRKELDPPLKSHFKQALNLKFKQ